MTKITKMTNFCAKKLMQSGHFMDDFVLNDSIKSAVLANNYPLIDREFKALTSSEGPLFSYLRQFAPDFESIEFIISLRDADNDWEEDGIWHDDGSRVLAFSLSLTIESNQIEGGELHIRNKSTGETAIIPPFEYGKVLVFLTGTSGYEHRIHEVTRGKRLIVAGWCS